MSDNPDKQRQADASGRIGGTDPNNQIASKLKAFYSSVEQEPIPDMFLDLLEKLDRAEKSDKG